MVHRHWQAVTGGGESANVFACVLRHSPFPPFFTACARSRFEVFQCGVRFEGKYSAVAGLVHAFGSWQRCV